MGYGKCWKQKNKAHLASLRNPSLVFLRREWQSKWAEVQKKTRVMEDDWWRKIASDLQGFTDTGDLQNFYGSLKQVFGPTSHSLPAVKSKEGTVLNTDKQHIMSRWQEHYRELLNTRNTCDPAVLDTIPDKLIVHDIDTPPSIEELNCAIRSLKNSKS